MHPWASERQRAVYVVYFVCVCVCVWVCVGVCVCVALEQHGPGSKCCLHQLLVYHLTSLQLSSTWMGICPSYGGCD